MRTCPLLHIDIPLLVRGGRPLLRDVSLTVSSGQGVHITGPNGVGKSSLLRAMVGLLPFQGPRPMRTPSVFFLPTDNDMPDEQTAKTYISLWQRFERCTLKESLTHPATPKDCFVSEAVLAKPMHHLSSGMHQRVRLSLLAQTQCLLWILDEPWRSLDQEAARVLDACIIRRLAQGGAVIWTSHDQRPFPFVTQTLDLSAFVAVAETEDRWPF